MPYLIVRPRVVGLTTMKLLLHIGLALAFALPLAGAVEHEWTNKRGGTFKAGFISATDQAVTISIKGKTYRVKLADLSPQSQALARQLRNGRTGPKPFPHGRERIVAKMKRITIPRISFHRTPLHEALQTIMQRSWENDATETNPAAKGVHIRTRLAGNSPRSVTLQLHNMSLEKVLDFMTEQSGLTYEVQDESVVVLQKTVEAGPQDPFNNKLLSELKPMLIKKAKSRGLDIGFFRVNMEMIDEMSGDAAAGKRSDPFSAAEPENVGKILDYLGKSGIGFDESKGQQFVFDGFQVMVTCDSAKVARVKKLLDAVRAKTKNRK